MLLDTQQESGSGETRRSTTGQRTESDDDDDSGLQHFHAKHKYWAIWTMDMVMGYGIIHIQGYIDGRKREINSQLYSLLVTLSSLNGRIHLSSLSFYS